MTPYEMVGYTLLNTSAVTNIVGVASARTVTHGLRPRNGSLPSINYFAIGGGLRFWGIERQAVQISCRADTPGAARDLNRVVTTVFAGAQGTGVAGTINGFDLRLGTLRADQGLIPEEKVDGQTVYNAPVDIQIVYAASTVS